MPNAVIGRKVLTDAMKILLFDSVYTVHLYTNNYTPVVDSLPANFTEASYDTYPAGGISPPLPSVGNIGNQVQMSTVGVTFPPPAASGPVTIYGYYVLYQSAIPTIGLNILTAALFPAPVTLTNGGAPLSLALDFRDLDVNNP